MPIIAQMPGLDPTPYTAWGVLGLLGVSLIVMLGVVWKLITQQTANMKTRDELIMNFVDRHRSETTKTLAEVANTIAASGERQAAAATASNEKIGAILTRHTRMLDEVLMSNRVLDKISAMKQSGVTMSQAEIETLVRTIMHERSTAREG